MREIKFRAWNTDDKEMHEVKSLHFGENDYQKVAENLNKKGNHDSFYGKDGNSILMQFTGLKDKNGKEIYDGDVVIENDKNNWLVKFDIDYVGFYPFTYCSDGLGYECGRVSPDLCEVIGNIYESPELLKKENGHLQNK